MLNDDEMDDEELEAARWAHWLTVSPRLGEAPAPAARDVRPRWRLRIRRPSEPLTTRDIVLLWQFVPERGSVPVSHLRAPGPPGRAGVAQPGARGRAQARHGRRGTWLPGGRGAGGAPARFHARRGRTAWWASPAAAKQLQEAGIPGASVHTTLDAAQAAALGRARRALTDDLNQPAGENTNG